MRTKSFPPALIVGALVAVYATVWFVSTPADRPPADTLSPAPALARAGTVD
jgi:hypothetical protein